jgi:hypothetical protein
MISTVAATIGPALLAVPVPAATQSLSLSSDDGRMNSSRSINIDGSPTRKKDAARSSSLLEDDMMANGNRNETTRMMIALSLLWHSNIRSIPKKMYSVRWFEHAETHMRAGPSLGARSHKHSGKVTVTGKRTTSPFLMYGTGMSPIVAGQQLFGIRDNVIRWGRAARPDNVVVLHLVKEHHRAHWLLFPFPSFPLGCRIACRRAPNGPGFDQIVTPQFGRYIDRNPSR